MIIETTEFARSLRKISTEVEKKLWKQLRNRNFYNLKFRRQYFIKPYIVDFICLEQRLIIELDGGQHNFEENTEKDRIRDNFFKSNNFRIIRFWNHEVNSNFEGILEKIKMECGVKD